MEIRIATNEVVREYLERPWPKFKPFRPSCRINMVSSFDGKINMVGSDKKVTYKGLGSNLARYVMEVIRTKADMVLWGAETLRRSENINPLINKPDLLKIRAKSGLSTQPVAAIVTRKGLDLPIESPFFTSPDFEAVVFISDSAPKSILKELRGTARKVVTFPDKNFKALAEIIRKQYGAERLLIEGGPIVNDNFIKADLVDEIYLTTSYKIVSGSPETGIKGMTEGEPLEVAKTKQMTPLSIFYVPETNELFQSLKVE